jgi:hypothetical protein
VSDEPSYEDALLTVLAAMKAELDGIIGDEIARLQGVSVGSASVVVGETAQDDGRLRAAGVNRERAEPSLMQDAARSSRPPDSWQTPSSGRDRFDSDERQGEDSDAERRLDALALRLEGRLKRPRDRASEFRSPTRDGELTDSPMAGRGAPRSEGV